MSNIPPCWRYARVITDPAAAAPHRTVGLTGKNPPNIRVKNSWNWLIILMPATVWQILSMKWACNERKRKLCESSETWLEKFVRSHQVNLFSVGFSHLEPMCARRWAVAQFLALLVVPWYVKSCYLGQETCIISKHQATTMTIAIILYQMQMPSYSKTKLQYIPIVMYLGITIERNNQK